MSDLLQKQNDFLVCQAELVLHVRGLGYLLTAGELWRSDEQAEINAIGDVRRTALATLCYETEPDLSRALLNNGKAYGIRNSLHALRLAFDGNLFVFENGVWVPASVSEYIPLGVYWKTLHPLARWGGDFARPDSQHFSLEHNGVR